MTEQLFHFHDPDFDGFYDDNPDLDIIHINLTDKKYLTDIKLGREGAAREKKLAALKAYQRLARLGCDGKLAILLKDKGLHSAQSIAAISEDLFVTTHKADLAAKLDLPDTALEQQLRRLHGQARTVKARVYHLWANMHDTLSSHLRATRFFDAGDHFATLVADIPDYETLFGNVDYCECAHCGSIFGAAAYLTDILRVTAAYITKVNTAIPQYYKLSERRPDIFSMGLTCENTDTIVPFLNISNHVIGDLIESLSSVDDADYEAATQVPNFSLPINMPLITVMQALKQMDSSLLAVYRVLENSDGKGAETLPLPADLDRQALGLSVEQLRIAATAASSATALAQFYNQRSIELQVELSGTFSAQENSTTVTASTAGFKGELEAGGVVTISGISRIVESISSTDNSFEVDAPYGNSFSDQDGVALNPASILQYQVFSQAVDLDFDGLNALFCRNLNDEELQANIPAFFYINGITAANPWLNIITDKSDPAALIQYLGKVKWINGSATYSAVELDDLGLINRFDRLARWLDWEPMDLDIALRASGGKTLDGSAVYTLLAQTKIVSHTLKLKLDQTASLWGPMNTYGRGNTDPAQDLFDRVYNRPTLLLNNAEYHPVYAENPLFVDPVQTWTIEGQDTTSMAIRAWLRGCLGLGDNDLSLAANFVSSGNSTLSLDVENLSGLYRITLMAKALLFTVPQLIATLDSIGNGEIAWTPDIVQDLIAFKTWLTATGLSLDDFNYLTNGEVSHGYRTPLETQDILPYLKNLWAQSTNWLITTDTLATDTQTPEQDEQVFDALVSHYIIDSIGVVILDYSAFQASAVSHKITPQDLQSPNLVSAAQAEDAFERLVISDVLNNSGVLQKPVDKNTALSYLFPSSAEQPSQIDWVRSVLAEVSLEVGFDLISPAFPLQAADLEVGPITQSEAAQAFTELQGNDVLDANGALKVPFSQNADLSYLFEGDAAKIDIVRTILVTRNTLVLQVASTVLTSLNSQSFGVFASLDQLFSQSVAMSDVLAPYGAEAEGIANIVATLLTPIPQGSKIPNTLINFFQLLGKFSMLAKKFDLDPWDMRGAVDYPAIFNFTDLKNLTMDVLKGLSGYAVLLHAFKLNEGELITALAFPDDSFETLAKLTGWNQTQISLLASTFWTPKGIGWSTVAGLGRMNKVFTLAEAIGANIQGILNLGNLSREPSLPLPVFGDSPANGATIWQAYTSTADIAFNAMHAHFDEEDWRKNLDTITCNLNETRRDAYVPVVLQLLQATRPGITTPRALSEYLLLDVETSGCESTSLIVQAIASVQTYMQRCRLQLEPGVNIIAFPEVWWEWLSAYRVWEANRKIYVYPENYIEPGLRKVRTPLFTEFQNQLSQGEITGESVYNNFENFMNGFSEVASLQIMDSMYMEAPAPYTGVATDTLFMVGRSAAEPYEFYIRRLLNFISWTPWEKVDVKIPSATVVPIYALDRLLLTWAETETTQINNISSQSGAVAQTNAVSYSVRLKYTFQRFANKWTAPQTLGKPQIYNFQGYVESYAPWGIDYTTIHPDSAYWHQPYSLPIPDASDPSGSRMVVMIGRAWQQSTSITVNPPDPTPFTSLNSLLKEVQAAATIGSYVVQQGIVGAVPLLTGYTLDNSMGTTNGSVVMFTNQGNAVHAVYASAYEDDTNGPTLGMYLSDNPFIANSLSNSELLANTSELLNPWYVEGPQPTLFNLADAIAEVKPVKNQIGWFVFNNGDEAFLGCSQIDDLKKLSDTTSLNSVPLGTPTDILLQAGPSYPTTPNLATMKVKFYRLTTGAIGRVSSILMSTGVPSMLSPAVQLNPGPAGLSFTRFYSAGQAPAGGSCDPSANTPVPPATVIPPSLLCGGQIDFGGRNEVSAYGLYWRELYFHIPFLIAAQLNLNQKFEQAKQWYEYIFDPMSDEQTTPANDRFWQYIPFRGLTPPSLLEILTDQEAINDWNNNPFDPHAIAALRVTAYQKSVVMKYIDNLLDWADFLFAQETRESITQATLLYFLAADLLGPRPVDKGPCPTQAPMSFNDMLAEYGDPSDIPEFLIHLEQALSAPAGTAVVVGENSLPFNDINAYFCVPDNPDLVAYWDKVEDRLFKLRHCMNIEGIVRQLPLFQPPIDPRLLVSAAASGGNVRDIIEAADISIPNYRFWTMLDRAKSLSSLLSSFGQSLLQALERKDTEALNMLQNVQQGQILNMTTRMKRLAVEEATDTLASLQQQLEGSVYRQNYYQTLVDEGLSPGEASSLVYMTLASVMSLIGGGLHTAAGVAHLVPNVGSPFAMTYGGKQVGSSLNAFGTFFDTIAGQFTFASNMSSTVAGYERRAQDWQHQADLAGYEIEQINQQIAAALQRQLMAERDLEINQESIDQFEQMKEFLSGKFTNKDLYDWMAKTLSSVYFQAYQTAYNMALSAQKAMQYELDTSDNFVKYGYWSSLRKGLTAGENLSLALAQMEQAYLQRNSRRFTVERTVSLMQIDPLALINLQETGTCNFSLSARLFDFDFPGLYARKISNLSVTIPAVTGPYESINGTLTQLANYTVLQPSPETELFLLGKSGVATPDSAQLRVNWRANQQILISTGVDDSGLPRQSAGQTDDRYTPFEGTGAISQWRLDLPQGSNRIDLSSIPDVVLQISYTAQQGGATMQAPVINELKELGYSGGRLVFLANQYADGWYGFMHPPQGAQSQSLSYATPRSLFPGNLNNIEMTEVYLCLTLAEGVSFTGAFPVQLNIPGLTNAQQLNFSNGNLQASFTPDAPITDFMTGNWTLTVNQSDIPPELKDPDTGMLSAEAVLNIGQIMLFDAEINWD